MLPLQKKHIKNSIKNPRIHLHDLWAENRHILCPYKKTKNKPYFSTKFCLFNTLHITCRFFMERHCAHGMWRCTHEIYALCALFHQIWWKVQLALLHQSRAKVRVTLLKIDSKSTSFIFRNRLRLKNLNCLGVYQKDFGWTVTWFFSLL